MNEPEDVTQEPMEDLQDELRWDSLFERTQPQLVAAARRARQQIAADMATPMDYRRLARQNDPACVLTDRLRLATGNLTGVCYDRK